MRLDIHVTPGAKKEWVKELDGIFRVYVTAPAAGGQANDAAISVLAHFFRVKKNQITIIRGHRARRKTIDIAGMGTYLSPGPKYK